MSIVEIQNSRQPLKSPINATYCSSFFCQLRGLMFRRSLAPDEGLLLVQKRENRSESAIHMLFMFMDIAVVWLNASKQVVDVKYARRWHLFYAPQSPAKYVLELPHKHIEAFHVGDQLQFNETNLA